MKNNQSIKIAIASGKGGVGKSMLSSSLAMCFSRNKKVVAVDCDVDAPNLAVWLNEVGKWEKIKKISVSEKPIFNYSKCIGCGLCAKSCQFSALTMQNKKPALNPFFCEGCSVCQLLCPNQAIKLKPVKNGEIKIKTTKYGFKLISGQLYPGEAGSGKIVFEVKKQAEKFECDVIIIDSSPGTGCPVNAALQDVNFVVLVTEPTPSGLADMQRVLGVVNFFKIPYGVIINKWDINKDLSQKIERWADKKLLGKIFYEQKIFKAIANLQPIMETDLKTKKEIQSIFTKLTKICN